MKSFGRVIEAEETQECKSHMMMLEETCNPGTWIHAGLSLRLLFHFTRLETLRGLRARAHAGTRAGMTKRAGTDGESVGLPPVSDPETQSAVLRPPEPVRAVGHGPPAAQGDTPVPPPVEAGDWGARTGASGRRARLSSAHPAARLWATNPPTSPRPLRIPPRLLPRQVVRRPIGRLPPTRARGDKSTVPPERVT